jgi:hypothetical protein
MSKEKTVTVEWRLPQGSAGVATAMAHAQLRSRVRRIAAQHGFEVTLYTTQERYKVRAQLTEKQYTILCLEWQQDRDFLQWKIVEE